MNKEFISAYFTSYTNFEILIQKENFQEENLSFIFYKNNQVIPECKIISTYKHNNIYQLCMECSKIELGYSYYLKINDLSLVNINVNNLTQLDDFDELNKYEGNDLGSSYFKNETIFKLWAPLASDVFLKIKIDEEFKYYPMERKKNGLYQLTLKGDYLNCLYQYVINNSGIITHCNDPYAKASNTNTEFSAVIDLNVLSKIKEYKPTNKINNYVDCIIYETNVRDFTEDSNTNIVNKGKFLGFVEENKVTLENHPAGLDYLKYLGITHVQLNPIIDFDNVDDINWKKTYNWGYDPISFFNIEGSYSTHPNDPMNRLIEFKQMVEQLHKNNIRVVMDVVYNHIYDYPNSVLEKSVPNYYFRKTKNNDVAKASGCGNDIASEKFMARKLIVESIIYFVKYFNVDGFRFDLMGLIDIDTINEAVSKAKEIKNDLIFYGEGWNMGDELPFDKKACKENHDKLNNMGFFNDSYRDFLKGGTFKDNIMEKGYIGGDSSYCYGLDFSFHGSVLPLSYNPCFSNANQSINYIECHDNYTLFDKLMISNSKENLQLILKRINFANSLLLLSFGVPFIHMGQEIGLSKNGLDNTYNVTKINKMDYHLVDVRFNMVTFMRCVIKLRQKLLYTSLYKKEDIQKVFEIKHQDDGTYQLISKCQEVIYPYKELIILINPTSENKTYQLDDYYSLLTPFELSNGDSVKVLNGILPFAELQVLYK